MTATSDSADHVRKAGEHLRAAARTWGEQFVRPEVRTHLRDAGRSLLQAGIAAIDACERRDRERQAAAQPAADPAPTTA